MSTVRLHLTRLASTAVLLLLLLLAALLALGWHANAPMHVPASISAHHAVADVDAPPPGH